MVDPRMFGTFDLADSVGKGMQIRQARDEQQNRKRLGDLLPDVMTPGGGIGGDNLPEAQARREAAMREIAHIDPRLFMQLDERQRSQASAELDDVAAAVRWADTPEKWAQVQQYYGSHGHDVSAYPFESRESVVLQLGKIGEYLKAAPQAEYKTLEPGGSLIDVSGGNPRVVIAPNDGSQQIGSPVQQGGDLPRVSDQQSYDSVPPGSQYMTPDGHVRVKQGGPSQGGSGGFPF